MRQRKTSKQMGPIDACVLTDQTSKFKKKRKTNGLDNTQIRKSKK